METMVLNKVENYKRFQHIPQEAIFFDFDHQDKIESFEKILAGKIEQTDSLSDAVQKIVKTVLHVEFGEKMIKGKQAENMAATIARSILDDNDLRKQVLIIIDWMTKPQELNA